MLVSSIYNSVPFKAVDLSELPNEDNRLFNDLNHGAHGKIEYCWPWNNGDTIPLQFESDDNTVPTLTAYLPNGVTKVVTGSLVSSREGLINRYYFNFNVLLSSDYHDKKTYFKVEHGSDLLTSAPIFTEDLTERIENGEIKKIEYSNFDKYVSDLYNRSIDWTVLTTTDKTLGFYIEAVTREINLKDEVEVLETTDTIINVSANNFKGIIFKSGFVSSDAIFMISTAFNLDYLRINDKEYVKPDGIEHSIVGESNLFECTIPLFSKYTLGFNTDDLGFESSTENDEIMNFNYKNKSADFDIARADGYSLHQVLIVKKSGSDATVTCGNSLGKTEYIDSFSGLIEENDKVKSFIPHHTPDLENGGRIYFGISGTGVTLDIYVQFIKITE